MKERILDIVTQVVFAFFCCLGGVFVGTGIAHIIQFKQWYLPLVALGCAIVCVALGHLSAWVERRFSKHE